MQLRMRVTECDVVLLVRYHKQRQLGRENLFYIPSQQTGPQQEVNLCSISVSLRGSADDSSIMESFAVSNSE
jgi:hypothetical protein